MRALRKRQQFVEKGCSTQISWSPLNYISASPPRSTPFPSPKKITPWSSAFLVNARALNVTTLVQHPIFQDAAWFLIQWKRQERKETSDAPALASLDIFGLVSQLMISALKKKIIISWNDGWPECHSGLVQACLMVDCVSPSLGRHPRCTCVISHCLLHGICFSTH